MCRRARPAIPPRDPDHLRPNRVSLDVTQRPPPVNVIQAARKKPVLPEVSATPVPPIDLWAISQVRWADGLRPRILQSRRPHEIDVVGHPAIALRVKTEALAVLAEEFEVRTAVVIIEQNILVRL